MSGNQITFPQPLASLIGLGVVTVVAVKQPVDPLWVGETVEIRALAKKPRNFEHSNVDSDLPPVVDLIVMSSCWEWWEHPNNQRHGGTYRWVGPLGQVVATVTIQDCLPIVQTDDRKGLSPTILICPSGLFRSDRHSGQDDYNVSDQLCFSSFTPGAFALILTDAAPQGQQQ